jgi:uncharacterized membrane protein YjgN (DUF898 family)
MSESAAGLSGYTTSAASNTAPRVNIPFEFRGSGGEYFRIWIVNLLLTIVTLGIYSAWAKVRRMRYFYGNTILDGHSFEYHAKPLQILKGRLIVFGAYLAFSFLAGVFPLIGILFIPVIIFGIPWIIQKARIFQMRVTSYRNLRFNFHGDYRGAMSAFIGWYLIAVLTLGILFPLWLHKRVSYSLGNSAYGKTPFRFVTPSSRFFAFCYATAGLAILAYAAAFALLFASIAGSGGIEAGSEPSPTALLSALGVAGIFGILLIAAAAMGIWGYYQARFANASFGGIELGNARVVSEVKAWPLAWIEITNLLGMVFTLGLFYPWAAIRKARYQLENTSLDTAGGLAEFQAAPGEAGEALGEELGEFFDVDFGI